ncbi:sulfatase [soil metagenome]
MKLSLLLPIFCGLALQEEGPGRPPNIVFVMADDLGWADLACYGNRFHETPNLDRLAAGGMRFTDAYAACPVCSPTRASIVSGQYQARFGLTDFLPGHWRPFARLEVPDNAPRLPPEIVTVAESLRSAGYATGHFGKWHLGGGPSAPEAQGFERSVEVSGGYFAPALRSTPPIEIEPGTPRPDFLTGQAIDFLEEHRDRPVFIHLSYHSVHIPLAATAERIEKYQNKQPFPGYPIHPVYAAMLEDLDASVGRLVEAIDRLGITEQTLLIFFSDNGGLYRGRGNPEVITSNHPLRGEKGSLYEGGIRVPMIVRWPGRVEPGSMSAEPVTSVDFYPTFLDAAGAGPDVSRQEPLDGESLLPILTGSGTLERPAIYWHYPHYHHWVPAGAIRSGKYKLHESFEDGSIELYDLETDIGEDRDLSTEQPEKAEALRKRLQDWRESVGARMPGPNPEYDPDQAMQWWNRRTGQPLPAAADRPRANR